jgi:hypothetical protein
MMDDTENESNVNSVNTNDGDGSRRTQPFRRNRSNELRRPDDDEEEDEEEDEFAYEGDNENSPRRHHPRNPRYAPYTDDATLSTHQPDEHDGASTYNMIDLPPPTTVAMVPIMTSNNNNNMGMASASASSSCQDSVPTAARVTAAAAVMQPAVIAVAPENVSLVHDVDTNDRDERFLRKHNHPQHVEIL